MNISLVTRILDTARDLLKGEPARAIGYGAAAAIYLVALAFDRVPDMTPEDALTAATAAIITITGVIETIRRFVYSVNTVEAIAVASAEAGTPVVPAPPASSDAVADEFMKGSG